MGVEIENIFMATPPDLVSLSVNIVSRHGQVLDGMNYPLPLQM